MSEAVHCQSMMTELSLKERLAPHRQQFGTISMAIDQTYSSRAKHVV